MQIITRSLVVDGHRVEVNPNSRVRRSIVRCDQMHRSLLRLRVFFVANFLQHG